MTIGKIRIVDKLGRGGMGTVYTAVDETFDRETPPSCCASTTSSTTSHETG